MVWQLAAELSAPSTERRRVRLLPFVILEAPIVRLLTFHTVAWRWIVDENTDILAVIQRIE